MITRLTTVWLLVTLLLPVLFVGNAAPVAASSFSTAPPAPAVLSAPPAPFNVSSDSSFSSLTNTALSSIVSLNQSLRDGYRFVAAAVNPQPPDGLALAKMPTVPERVSASLSSATASLYSSVSSAVVPLFVETTNSASSTLEPLPAPPPPPPGINKFDFDGDGKTDAARWQPSTGEWRYKKSSDNAVVSLALGTTTGVVAVPADYDGDGKTDPAIFTNWAGSWKIKYSSTGQEQTISPFGQPGDKVVAGDYDGDGTADLAVFRPSNGTWYIRQSSNLQIVTTSWGQSGDIPVPGNYDGAGGLDYAVFRPSNGSWYVQPNGGGSSFSLQWGIGSDTPVPSDYDGDGKTDFAIYRPSTGAWYAYRSDSNNGAYIGKIWGNYGDQPVPGYYDNDGKADFAVWRPTTGIWYIVKSTDATYNNYAYQQLGVAGDVAAPSAYLKQVGGQVLAYDLANARLSPKNQAGGGTNLYSRNFGWSANLVNLPGRAGLDAGFGISYNSLVWTKEPTSNTVVFDADHANVSPGFRFGFPTIEPPYYNGLTARFSYLMVMPSGSRVEFRQVAASNVYEAEDSSYAQLTVNAPPPVTGQTTTAEQLTILVRTTDGTQMSYDWRAGAYRLNEIKDRNGNFITVVYDAQYGLLQSVTDTLGRTVNINYDAEFYPTSITQQWQTNNGAGNATTHTYATFAYGYQEINPTFNSAVGVFGPAGGTYIKVLNQITYADGTATTFWYNSYGQVWKIRNIAADSSAHVLNSTATNLETPDAGAPSGGHTDCPRLSMTKNFVENFNNNQETILRNYLTPNGSFTGGGETLSPADVVEVTMDNAPHNISSKTYYHMAGNWQEGLPFASEDFGDNTRQRWTRTVWAQDTNTLYKVNPRVIESKVGDAANIKRTKIYYRMQTNSTVASFFGLVEKVEVYDANQTTILKKAETDYDLSSTYLNRRIIGLPSEQRLYDQSDALMSKVGYVYDQGDFSGTEQNISTVIQHDNTNYGASFIAGRGNLTSTTRYDVSGITANITTNVKYNTAGGVTAQITPGSAAGTTRQVSISYLDSFNDSTPRNTFAYPTTLTDPAGNSSTVKYRFDIGANVWAKSPNPNSTYTGKTSTRVYDNKGRLEKEAVGGAAYTRYEYPANGVQLRVFSTVNDTTDNGADTADEVLTESWTDGAGRTLQTITAHPDSTGGWSATKTEYDILGQVKRATAPTEVNGSWQLAGDGQTRGWLWKSQEYDWKGRTTKITETDGTFKTMSYDGCGCAGGEIVTIEGEQLADGKRKQRIYSDILGRKYKTETFNWNDTVYSSSIVKYNGRDQVEWSKQFVGAASADALTSDSCPMQQENEAQSCQITKMTYDGHARLKTQHAPQQNTGAVTLYDYYDSDEVRQVTDARGATTLYAYNNRGLVSSIISSMPELNTPQGTNGSGNWATSGAPYGFLEEVNSQTGIASGWSLDPDTPNTPVLVHFYIDGAAGQGTYIGQATANLARADVNTETGQPGNHGFEFAIPSQYLDGSQHTLYAYGIDTGGGNNPLLSNAPKSFAYSINIAPTTLNSTTTIEYDPAGNRLWMTDNLGRTDYEFNGLGQLRSETRKFTDTVLNGDPLVMANAPLANNSFKLKYTYGLSGQLTSLTDPFDAVVNYAYDAAGRLKNVTGSSFGNVTNYAGNAKYQAWGGLKELTYGSNLQMTMTYNDRLQAATYNLAGGTSGTVMNKNYDYYADGSLRYAQDLLDAKFDRLNIYDHLGRIKEGKTGLEARSSSTVAPAQQSTDLPYRQSYQFNAFSNLTERNNLHWGIETWYGQNNNLSYTYKNNRVQQMGWQYDEDGRNLQTALPDDYATSVYNAAGQMVRSTSDQTDAVRTYDGNGREVKRRTANYVETENSSSWVLQPDKYYVRSSVLGNEVVSEVWANGRKGKTFVRAAGSQIAYQSAYLPGGTTLNEAVIFEYTDASGMSQRTSDRTGQAVATGDGGDGSPVETDPLGNNVGTATPYVELINPNAYEPDQQYPMLQSYFDDQPYYVNGQRMTCGIDGLAISCGQAFASLANGSAIPAALEAYQNLPNFSFQNNGLGIYTITVPVVMGLQINPNQTITPIYSQYSTRSYSFTVPWGSTWGTQQQQTQQQFEPLPSKEEFKQLLTNRQNLNNGECRKFLEAVLNNLGLSKKLKKEGFEGTMEGLFDYLTGEKKIGFASDKNLAGGNVGGESAHTAKGPIIFRPSPAALGDPEKYQYQMAYVGVLVHEMLHRAGVADHKRFGRAAFDSLSLEEQKNSPRPDGGDANSGYFSEIFNKKCKFDPYNESERKANIIP